VHKNLIIALAERLVRDRSRTVAGRMHDKRMGEEAGYTLPPGWGLFNATGCQGFAPDHVCPYQPKKKPRGQELRPDDKAEHKRVSRIRLLVEHVIAGVKRCRIVPAIFRNTKAPCDDLVMEIACGLHNFRATLRYAI
jgi:hypothetical protein